MKPLRVGQVVKYKQTLGVIVKRINGQRWRVLNERAAIVEADESDLKPGTKNDRLRLNQKLSKKV